ncbi:MAG TPA: acyltransferase family protein [Acidimicrobiales bacterium]|nr:acyltransferase family protein [Acidimicrobiales bacterium]
MTLTAAPVTTGKARPAKLRQLPGLDGLRGLAVIAVIAFHLRSSLLPGGYLGVDIFFVISGYLITALLLSEWAATSKISLAAFWRRRARRLFPALAVLLAAVTVLAGLFARDSLGRLQTDLPASMLYVLNWRLVFQHQSYVASFGRPPLLQHLWSLSVEEQFYLLWPLALIFLRHRMSRGRLALIAAGGAALSAVLMGALYQPGSDPSGVYFNSATHAEGLLIGCALAAAVPPWQMASSVAPGARRLLERSGAVALAAIVAGLALFGFRSGFTYRGGMLLVDVATAVVVATVAHPASRLGDTLNRQPLRWAGLRSYSLYLWHWPIFELTRPGADIPGPTWIVDVLRIALTLAAAELSYRYVEQPWRRGRFSFELRLWWASTSRRAVAGALAGAVVVPLAAVTAILATAPGPNEPAILAEGATPAARHLPAPPPEGPSAAGASSAGVPAGPVDSTTPKPDLRARRAVTVATAPPTTTPAPTTTVAPAPAPPAAVPASAEPVLALGDSVLLAASPALDASLSGHITIDAQVGRQVTTGLQRLAQYRATGALSHYHSVMIDLGTNGAFRPRDFQQLVQLVAGVPRVVLFDVHAARPWAATSNSTLAAGVQAHSGQMELVDWNSAATPAVLYPDGIHPNDAGAQLYTRLLKTALAARP